ncbi:MAG: hypothetical protein N2C12_18790, partial [Planctomycetales bacterium]
AKTEPGAKTVFTILFTMEGLKATRLPSLKINASTVSEAMMKRNEFRSTSSAVGKLTFDFFCFMWLSD